MTTNSTPAFAAALEPRCRAIVRASEGLLEWSFDARFRAATAVFTTADQGAVTTALEAGFDSVWDDSDIGGAPPRVSELAGKLGGLRPGQLLFAAEETSDPILFGPWWPWGNGASISIRILFSARTLDDAQKAELLAAFKGWFGLPA